MTKLLVVAISVLLAGCNPGEGGYTDAKSRFPKLPKELKDCQIFYVESVYQSTITVVRCPNSETSTTYQAGKTTQTVITIDGVEYQKVEK